MAAVWIWVRRRPRLAAGLALAVIVTLAGVSAARLAAPNPVVATVAVGSTPLSVAVDERTGQAFVVNNGDNTVSVIDTRSGNLRHTITVGDGPTTAIVDDPDHAVLIVDALVKVEEQTGQFAYFQYAGDAGGARGLSILDAATGQRRRTIPIDVSLRGAVADVHMGRVFVSRNDFNPGGNGDVTRLTVASGRVDRLASVPDLPLVMAVDARAGRLMVVSAASGGTVSVLDATSGRLVGRHVVGTVLLGHTLAIDEATGRAFVLTASVTANRGSVAVFDTHSGALVQTIALHSVPASVVVDEQTARAFVTTIGPAARITILPGYGSLSVPISTGSGTVLMLDAHSGAIIHSTSVGIAPGSLAVDTRRGRVLVAIVGAMDSAGNPTGPGGVSVLDARSGAMRRTVPVGVTPGDIAIDERAGRAIVLNIGGLVDAPDSLGWLPAPLRPWLPFVPRRGGGAHLIQGSVTVLDTARL